jgi:hypothetical protein
MTQKEKRKFINSEENLREMENYILELTDILRFIPESKIIFACLFK